MRAPWGTPTVSAGLGLLGAFGPKFGLGFANLPAGDSRLYALLLQASVVDDFPDLALWVETDSGGNVNLAGGVVTLTGSGAYAANGIAYNGGLVRAAGYWEIKVQTSSSNAATVGTHNAQALSVAPQSSPYPVNFYNVAQIRVNGGAQLGTIDWTLNTWFTIRYYLLPGSAASWKEWMVTIEGGAQYVGETVVGYYRSFNTAWPNPFYPQIQAYTLGAHTISVKEFRWYTGFSVAGETLTYVADAGSGKVFTGVVFANLAAVGGWATTNCTFAYSYDDGTPSYSAEYTLANLAGLAALTTHKRYLRVRVTVNSDGATQQYAGEINADDVLTGAETTGAVYPAAGNTLTGSGAFGPSGADYTPTLTLPAAGEVSNLADDFGNPDDPVEPTREDAEEGNVLAGSGNYGDPGDPLVPAYAPDFPDAANVLTNDTTDGAAGTAKIRVAVDAKIKAV